MSKTCLIETIVKEIELIGNTWKGKVSTDTLRRGSTILRILLVDNKLQEAWKAAGFSGEPHIIAPRLESMLDAIDEKSIDKGLAGGGEYEGVKLNLSLTIFSKEEDYSQIYSSLFVDSNINYKFKLSEFKEACGVFISGHRIKRREVIKYVANKLGGAHLDFNRNSKGDSVYKILDENRGNFVIQEDKDIIYFELLSIGQCIANSPDIKSFVTKIKTGLLPNENHL